MMEIQYLDKEQNYKIIKFRSKWCIGLPLKIISGKTKNELILNLLKELAGDKLK